MLYTPSYYINLRNHYNPININLIFLLESPPASGKYFYDTTGEITEPLYKAIMQAFNINAECKEEGLEEFCKHGYLIVDATYTSVNKMTNKDRNKTILDIYLAFHYYCVLQIAICNIF